MDTDDEGPEGQTAAEPFDPDAYFVQEATQCEAELQQVLAEVNDCLSAGMRAPQGVSYWQVLHFNYLAGRLLEGVRLCQQIATLLLPMDEDVPALEGLPPPPATNLIDLLAALPPPADAEEEAAARYMKTLYHPPGVRPPGRKRPQ